MLLPVVLGLDHNDRSESETFLSMLVGLSCGYFKRMKVYHLQFQEKRTLKGRL